MFDLGWFRLNTRTSQYIIPGVLVAECRGVEVAQNQGGLGICRPFNLKHDIFTHDRVLGKRLMIQDRKLPLVVLSDQVIRSSCLLSVRSRQRIEMIV